jgi:hypothetical protein
MSGTKMELLLEWHKQYYVESCRKRLRPSARRQVDVQEYGYFIGIVQTWFGEGDFTKKKTPLIQVIDRPILP